RMHSLFMEWRRPMDRRLNIVCVLLLSSACAAVARASDQVVYHDGLSSGWSNWSWSSTINFSAPTPAYGGAGASISVHYTAEWAGAYLHSAAVFSAADYERVRFYVHGGASGGQRIRFSAYDAGGAAGTSIALAPLAANQWTLVDTPIATLGVSTISGLVWQ